MATVKKLIFLGLIVGGLYLWDRSLRANENRYKWVPDPVQPS